MKLHSPEWHRARRRWVTAVRIDAAAKLVRRMDKRMTHAEYEACVDELRGRVGELARPEMLAALGGLHR